MVTYKMMKILLNIKYIILLLLFFLPSCAVNPVTGKSELMLVSEQQELKIGQESAPSLKWEFGGRYKDPELEAYLGNIVKQLWQTSERPHLPVSFYIQNTSLPNAFALPGYVAITRGLLCDMENEAQFVAVIGHEIGHVMARHTAQRLSRMQLQQAGLLIGAAALEGKKGGDALLTAGAIGSSLMLLKYDRGQEIQSDRLGARYMSMHGYDPNEAKSAHMVLEQSVDNYLKRLGKQKGKDTLVSNLLSTHPRKEVRLDEIQDMIDELPPYTIKGDGKFRDRFMSATKNIRAANTTYHKYDRAEILYQQKKYKDAENLLNEAITQNSEQPAFYNLMGLIKLQQKNNVWAKKNYQKALSIDENYQPSVYGMGLAMYFNQQYEPAIHQITKSLKLFPGHAPSYLIMGESYYKLRQYNKAEPYLANFAQAAPKHSEVHGILGICFENTGKIENAVIAYRNQLAVAPNTELGRHARNRLAVLEPMLKQ